MTPLGPATDEENASYRAGFCRDCHQKRHSAGRTRCENCHQTYVERMEKGEI